MKGLENASYWMSWWIFTSILNLVISLESAIIIAFGISTATNFYIWFIYLFLFGNAVFGFAVFMTAIFSKPRNAVSVGIILYFLSYYISFFFEENNYVGTWPRVLIGIVPSVCMAFGNTILWTFEYQTYRLSIKTINVQYEYMSMLIVWAVLLVSFAFWFFIGVYLD